MAELWNKRENRVQMVPDEEVAAAIDSGDYGMPSALVKDGRVNVRRDGQTISVPMESVQDAVAKGYTLETGWQRDLRQKESGRKETEQTLKSFEPVIAGTTAALSSATFGLSEYAIARDEATKRSLARIRGESPLATGLGTAVGALTPGGAGRLAAKGGLAAAKGAGKLLFREGVEQAAKSVVGGSLARKAIEGAVKSGIGGAVEGAGLGVAHGVSEHALGNAEDLATSILSNAGLGALMGGSVGSAIGATGALTASAAGRIAKAADKFVKEDGVVKAVATKVSRSSALRATGVTKSRVAKLAKSSGKTAEKATSEATARLDQISDTLRNTPAPDGDSIIRAGRTAEDVAERLAATVQERGSRIGLARAQMDDLASSVGVRDNMTPKSRIIERLRKEIIDPAKGRAGSKSVKNTANRIIDELDELPDELSIKDMFDRHMSQKRWWRDNPMEGTPSFVKSKFDDILRDEIDNAVTRMARHADDTEGFLKRYAQDKQVFSDLADIADYSQNKAISEAAGSWLGLGDKIYSAGGFAGALGGGGGVAEAAVTGGITGVAAKILRDRSASTIHRIAEKATTMEFIQKAATKLDDAIDQSVRGFSASSKPGVVVPLSVTAVMRTSLDQSSPFKRVASQQDAVREHSETLSRLIGNPGALADRIAAGNMSLEQHAPDTAAKLAEAQVKTIQYLHSQAPKAPTMPTMQPAVDRWKPTRAEAAKFSRVFAAAVNPASVLTSIKDRIVTREEIETLEALHPRFLERVRGRLSLSIGELQKRLDYSDRIQMSIVMGAPLDPTMQPDFIRRAQMVWRQQQPSSGHGQGGMRLTGLKSVTLDERRLTPTQRREAG